MKKFIIIIGFLVIAGGLAWLLWLVFFRPAVPPVRPALPIEKEVVPPRLPVAREAWEKMTYEERVRLGLPPTEWTEEVVPPEVAPPVSPVEVVVPEIDEVAEGRKTWVNPVSAEPALAATLSIDGKNSFYYDKDQGKFYKIDSLGNKELLTDQSFYNVEEVNWAPTKDRAVLTYPDGFKIMYDFDRKKQYTLPKNWEDFSWDPSGARIAFKSTSRYPENNWLAIARPDGSQAQPIEHMGDNADKVVVSWSPNNQVIAFSATGAPRGAWEQEILLIGQYGENFKSLVVDGRGFEPEWSPAGDKIAYSVYSVESGYQPRLYIVNAQGADIGTGKINLNLATWAHKCTFNKSGATLYCGVPRDLPEGVGLIPELATRIRDDFYKIDVATGEISFLAEGAMGGYDVEKIYLSDDESLLYFVDKNMGRLRYIRLK